MRPQDSDSRETLTMNATHKIFLAGAAGLTLLLSGCAGDVWLSAPFEGPYYGPFYGYHHFYGRSFRARHFVVGHGGGGYHGGGGHGGHR
jgi:hypothetical protein